MNPLHPKENTFMAALARIKFRLSRPRRRMEKIQAFARANPDIVEARINMAKAKRIRKEIKATMDNLIREKNYYFRVWEPRPAHNKPTYEELRKAGAA